MQLPISLDQSSPRKPPSIPQQEFPPEILERLSEASASESSFDALE
jgi:hypothetical protein